MSSATTFADATAGTTRCRPRRPLVRLGGSVVVTACALACVSAPPLRAAPTDPPVTRWVFWVSPTGTDANPGTHNAPFRTIQRARDAVRAVADRGGPATVVLRGGTYRMTEGLVLTARDSGTAGSPVTYRAASGEHPVLTGARRVPADRWRVGKDGLWRAHVWRADTRQLLVDGQLAQRARTPDYPSGFRPNLTAGGIQFRRTPLNAAGWRDPAKWRHVRDIEAVGVLQWKLARVPLDSVRGESAEAPGLVRARQPAWRNANLFRLSVQPGASPAESPPGPWSLWQVAWFENAREFLDEPGEWYLDRSKRRLFYKPKPGQRPETTVVEVPRLQALVAARGRPGAPVRHVSFHGLTFTGTTWLGPDAGHGYVDDQAGFHIVGGREQPNFYGHVRSPTAMPGSVRMRHAHHASFTDNTFTGLGAFGLALGRGTQSTVVRRNRFIELAGGAVQVGGIAQADHHPRSPSQTTRDNVVAGNRIRRIGVDFWDTPAISQGFALRSRISHNVIRDVPWSGISVGWGWGLLDPGGFPGIEGAEQYQWGRFRTPTINRGTVLDGNRISRFGQRLWDAGAIYTTGNQGSRWSDAMLIRNTVAHGKRPSAALNTFYTDGGTRYLRVMHNRSFDNPIGTTFVGAKPRDGDPLPPLLPLWEGNGLPYGGDLGGCRTFGDIEYVGNRWLQPPMQERMAQYQQLWQAVAGMRPWSTQGFFAPCPYTAGGVSYPTRLTFRGNTTHQVQQGGG